jgi:hypothetical protein
MKNDGRSGRIPGNLQARPDLSEIKGFNGEAARAFASAYRAKVEASGPSVREKARSAGTAHPPRPR